MAPEEPVERGEVAGEVPAAPSAAAFHVQLPAFAGPLDVLLHLIREHRLDIFDIPVAFVTERYLEYLDLMKALEIDVASEFLVMAAQLAHLKSRMLLPREERPASDGEEDEAVDPRADLVRRLLEHQKYLEAGEALGRRALLGRDTFARPPAPVEAPPEGPDGLAELSVFELIGAFARILETAKIEIGHEVTADRLSVSEAIAQVGDRIREAGRIAFLDLFAPALAGGTPDRQRVVVTFLAILEMVRLRLLRITQEASSGEIFLSGREAPGG